MQGINESIFMSALRAFFTMFFGAFGIAIACLLIGLAYYGIANAVDEETFTSKVKILPDAQGNRNKLSSDIPVLLQINLEGEIGTDKLTGKNIEEILLDSREDALKGRVKGILLKINSPGGGVNDSDSIYHLMLQYKERYQVPVFAFVDGLCASGGYYIACAADKIYASDVSLIGSIGVLAWPPFMNLADALGKIGVSTMTLFAGVDKDQMNPFRSWKPDEQAQYQSLINFYYNSFVDIVANSRSLQREILEKEYGAKIFPAPEAYKLGLVDKNAVTRSQVLDDLAQEAGITGKYQVVGFETKSWWKKLIAQEPSSPLFTGKVRHELVLPQHQGNPFSFIFIP
jgi:protease IV